MKITNPANLALNEITYGLPIIDIVNYTLDKALHLMAHPIPDENTPDGKKPIRFAIPAPCTLTSKPLPSFSLSIPPVIPNQDTDDTDYQSLPQDMVEKMTTVCEVRIYPVGKIHIDITAPDNPFTITFTIQSSKIITENDLPMEKPEDCLTLFDQIHCFANVYKNDKKDYTQFNAVYNPFTKKSCFHFEIGAMNQDDNTDPVKYNVDNIPSEDYFSLVNLFSDMVNVAVNTKNEIKFGIFYGPVENDNPTADDTDPDCTQLSTPSEDNSTPEHL